MTFVPAVIVFVLVFLSFSKEVLAKKEDPKKAKAGDTKPSMADVLLKYELMHGLEENSQ
ncbi:MAG: hypothetical protein AAFZ35_07870 [Cyanobacteria bacterium J06649_12]